MDENTREQDDSEPVEHARTLSEDEILEVLEEIRFG